MRVKDLAIVGGKVYLNIVSDTTTKTTIMPARRAVAKYGQKEVIEHIPYDGKDRTAAGITLEKGVDKPGTDFIKIKA